MPGLLKQQGRRGATMVETAITLSVACMVTLGLIVVGLGVSRYQQVASLAREGARYASVHGMQYQTETGSTAATATDIDTYIRSMAAGLDLGKLATTQVTWNTNNWPSHDDLTSNPPGAAITNTVTVKVSYQWVPELYIGSLTLSSTSVMPMSY